MYSDRDDDVRIRTRDDGCLVMGALSRAGMDTLTEMACSEVMRGLEDAGKIEVRRLPCGGVYLIIAEEGLIEVEYPDDDTEIH